MTRPELFDKKWARAKATAQKQTHYMTDEGTFFARIPHDGPDVCRDCGVTPGQLHVGGNYATPGSPPFGYPLCCVETCPACKGQALSCNCELAPARVEFQKQKPS